MADVLGEGVVAHHRTVLVPPLGGPQVHAHGSSVSAAVRRENVASSCAHAFRSGHPPSPAKKPMESRAARDPAGRNVPTDRKLRPGRARRPDRDRARAGGGGGRGGRRRGGATPGGPGGGGGGRGT